MRTSILFVAIYFLFFCKAELAQTDKSSDSNRTNTNSGLIFEKDTEHRLDDSTYTNTIQLMKLNKKAQALQFRILLNKSDDDKPILKFKDIQKGNDLKDPSWLLDYNVIKGPITPGAESQDEIFVVLYNSNQNGGLMPGNYTDLIRVFYEVTDLTDSQNEIKSSMKISHAQASTFDGFPVDITSSRDELKIFARNK